MNNIRNNSLLEFYYELSITNFFKKNTFSSIRLSIDLFD